MERKRPSRVAHEHQRAKPLARMLLQAAEDSSEFLRRKINILVRRRMRRILARTRFGVELFLQISPIFALGIPVEKLLENLNGLNLPFAFISSFISPTWEDSQIRVGGILFLGNEITRDQIWSSLLFGCVAGTVSSAFLAYSRRRRQIGWKRLVFGLFLGLTTADLVTFVRGFREYSDWAHYAKSVFPEEFFFDAIGAIAVTLMVLVARRYLFHLDQRRLGLLNLRFSWKRSAAIGLGFPLAIVIFLGLVCSPIPQRIQISSASPTKISLYNTHDASQYPVAELGNVVRLNGEVQLDNAVRVRTTSSTIFIKPHNRYLAAVHFASIAASSGGTVTPSLPGDDLGPLVAESGAEFNLGTKLNVPPSLHETGAANIANIEFFSPSSDDGVLSQSITAIFNGSDQKNNALDRFRKNSINYGRLSAEHTIAFSQYVPGFAALRELDDQFDNGAILGHFQKMSSSGDTNGGLLYFQRDTCGRGCDEIYFNDNSSFVGLQDRTELIFAVTRCAVPQFDFVERGSELIKKEDIAKFQDGSPFVLFPNAKLAKPYFGKPVVDAVSLNHTLLDGCTSDKKQPAFIITGVRLTAPNQAVYFPIDTFRCTNCSTYNIIYHDIAKVVLRGGSISAQIGSQDDATIPGDIPLSIYNASSVTGDLRSNVDVTGESAWVVENTHVLNQTIYAMIPIEIKIALALGAVNLLGVGPLLKKHLRI